MASLNVHVVEWAAAVDAARSGVLSDYLFRDYDNEDAIPETSLDDFTATDSCSIFNSVGMAYEALREDLPSEFRNLTDSWFWRIFGRMAGAEKWYADSPDLFGDNGQSFQASFSPETVANLARLGAGIHFEHLQKAFDARCPKDVLEDLTEFCRLLRRPGRPFDGCFVPYLRGWVGFLEHLSASGKGFLVYVG